MDTVSLLWPKRLAYASSVRDLISWWRAFEPQLLAAAKAGCLRIAWNDGREGVWDDQELIDFLLALPRPVPALFWLNWNAAPPSKDQQKLSQRLIFFSHHNQGVRTQDCITGSGPYVETK